MYKVAIEAGGTKMVVGILDDNYQVIDQISVKTTTPDETIPQIIEYIKKFEIKSIGIGSFGPIDLNKNSDTYGFITTTPKLAWANYDFVGSIKKHFDVPIGFDTDVNAACLAEAKQGVGVGKNNIVYLTIGTGVGGGIMINNQLVHGMSHPEMGHVQLKRLPHDTFEGSCPYHKDCLEGLCAGPSLKARTGIPGEDLPIDHEAWDYLAYYLGQALANYILTISPEIIILGGGVMQQEHLIDKIRQETLKSLNGYVTSSLLDDIKNYIVTPKLFPISGLIGSAMLGE